jgi:hypothetical protein
MVFEWDSLSDIVIGTCTSGGSYETKVLVDTLRALSYARVVELVDTHALGACAFGREGSSPFSRTKENTGRLAGIFFGIESATPS